MTAPHRGAAAAMAALGSDPEPATLSPMTYISIDTTSVCGRRKYVGRFRYKVPTLADRIDMGVHQSRLLQGVAAPSADSLRIAEMLAYLAITIDRESAPKWWQESKSGAELYDHAPALALYQEALSYEVTFLSGSQDAEPDREGSAGRHGELAAGDVEPDIQPAAQRRTVIATLGKGGARTDPHGEGLEETADEIADDFDAEDDRP